MLQGEDTVNFKVKCLPACLLVADVVAAYAASVVVVVDDATAANAHANADVDDAYSDAAASALCI